jgi:hypothetical protein
VVVIWPDGKEQVVVGVSLDGSLKLKQQDCQARKANNHGGDATDGV